MTTDPGALRHVVLFKLRPEHPPHLADELAADARALLAAGGNHGRVHRDLGIRPGHERAADVILEAGFPSRAALTDYLASAPHLAFLDRWLTGEGVTILGLQHATDGS